MCTHTHTHTHTRLKQGYTSPYPTRKQVSSQIPKLLIIIRGFSWEWNSVL